MSRSIVPPIAVEYPSGDGKPMAENDAQLPQVVALAESPSKYCVRDGWS